MVSLTHPHFSRRETFHIRVLTTAHFNIAYDRYCISVSFTMFNKWILTDYRGGFHFSTIYTTIHMFIQLLLSRLWYRYYHDEVIEPVSWPIFFKTVMPIGVATAVDIMLSNMALMYVTLTLYTIIKSSVLIWTFFWGVVLGIEKFRMTTFSAVIGICFGLSLAVASSTDVSMLGVMLVLGASGMSGIRWAMTQKLMVVDEQSTNIFVNVYRFVPSSAVSMLVVACIIDVKPFAESDFVHESSLAEAVTFFLFSCAGGVIAFVLITTEVYLVGLLSSLSLGVLGQVKEIIQIVLAMIVFHDRLNIINVGGIVIAMVAIGFYKKFKSDENKEQDMAYQTLKQVSHVVVILCVRHNSVTVCDV
jgi:solute carrier family 35, member C2